MCRRQCRRPGVFQPLPILERPAPGAEAPTRIPTRMPPSNGWITTKWTQRRIIGIGLEPRAYRRRHESKRPRVRMMADGPKHLLAEFGIVQWRAPEGRWCCCFVKVVIDQALACG